MAGHNCRIGQRSLCTPLHGCPARLFMACRHLRPPHMVVCVGKSGSGGRPWLIRVCLSWASAAVAALTSSHFFLDQPAEPSSSPLAAASRTWSADASAWRR
jgi:hypothetical protein